LLIPTLPAKQAATKSRLVQFKPNIFNFPFRSTGKMIASWICKSHEIRLESGGDEVGYFVARIHSLALQ
jgi:hypothetical protein